MIDVKAIRPLAADDETVLLRRADYEALVREAEDAADATQIREVEARIRAGEDEYVPIELIKRLMAGAAPVRAWREHRGLSARVLASRAGISAAYLSQIETGRKPGSFATMARLARALGVDSSRFSSLRKRQSVPSARSAFGLDLIMPTSWRRSAKNRDRILRVELTPPVVRQLGQRLKRVIVSTGKPGIDQELCRPVRLRGADIGSLQDGAQISLGGDRMRAHELAVAERDAAEILGPRPVRDSIEDHATDLARTQLLRLGGKPRNASTFPSANGAMKSPVALLTQSMSVCGSRPTYAAMLARSRCLLEPSVWGIPTRLSFRSLMVRMGSCANSS